MWLVDKQGSRKCYFICCPQNCDKSCMLKANKCTKCLVFSNDCFAIPREDNYQLHGHIQGLQG